MCCRCHRLKLLLEITQLKVMLLAVPTSCPHPCSIWSLTHALAKQQSCIGKAVIVRIGKAAVRYTKQQSYTQSRSHVYKKKEYTWLLLCVYDCCFVCYVHTKQESCVKLSVRTGYRPG